MTVDSWMATRGYNPPPCPTTSSCKELHRLCFCHLPSNAALYCCHVARRRSVPCSVEPFEWCFITGKHGLHSAEPAFDVALLECLQHSSGEITYGVRQSGIYRPRTQVVDGIGE